MGYPLELLPLRISTVLRPNKIYHGNNVVIDGRNLSYIKEMVSRPANNNALRKVESADLVDRFSSKSSRSFASM